MTIPDLVGVSTPVSDLCGFVRRPEPFERRTLQAFAVEFLEPVRRELGRVSLASLPAPDQRRLWNGFACRVLLHDLVRSGITGPAQAKRVAEIASFDRIEIPERGDHLLVSVRPSCNRLQIVEHRTPGPGRGSTIYWSRDRSDYHAMDALPVQPRSPDEDLLIGRCLGKGLTAADFWNGYRAPGERLPLPEVPPDWRERTLVFVGLVEDLLNHVGDLSVLGPPESRGRRSELALLLRMRDDRHALLDELLASANIDRAEIEAVSVPDSPLCHLVYEHGLWLVRLQCEQ